MLSLTLASLCLSLAPAPQDAAAPAGFDHSHALLTKVLQEFVVGEGVDYRTLETNRGGLDRYAKNVQAVTPRELASFSREQQFAFWINVYNAHVLGLIADNYPLKSITDLSKEGDAIWDRAIVPMPAHHPERPGKNLSLNDIENKLLRPVFEDARVHAAVNCASKSCPPLLNEAFVADNLERQLDSQIRRFVNDAGRNRYDKPGGVLRLSQIFNWFASDFEHDAGSVKGFLVRYLALDDTAFVRNAKVEFLEYSWALNEAELARPARPAVAEAAAPRGFDHTHAALTRVLRQHVKGDRVDYEALKADRGGLEGYAGEIQAVTPEQVAAFSRDEQFAFWVNVYNAHVLMLITNSYPLGSITDLSKEGDQIWDRGIIPMPAHHPEGKQARLSLNDVENKILRAKFEDARVHAAVNCASESCPPLLNEAFTAASLDQQLSAQMKRFVSDSTRNTLDKRAGVLRLSQIFNWFAGDFDKNAGSVKAYLGRYLDGDSSWLRNAKVEFIEYSWKLNDVVRRR